MQNNKIIKDVHGGNIKVNHDFSVNINPLGFSNWTESVILSNNLEKIVSDYPSVNASSAEKEIAMRHNVAPETIILGNGATEIFSLILQRLYIDKNVRKAICLTPCYSGYAEVCDTFDIEIEQIKFLDKKEKGFEYAISDDVKKKILNSDAGVVFIGYPNNPTGNLFNKKDLLDLIQKNPEKMFVIDESFMDFVENKKDWTFINNDIKDNCIVVKSLTKFFSIAGLRLGFAYGNVSSLRKSQLPWSVNGIAQEVANKIYSDLDYEKETIKVVCDNRNELSKQLNSFDEYFYTYDSCVNFVFCELRNDMTAKELQEKLLVHDILIRDCAKVAGLNNKYFRLAIKDKKSNALLIEKLNLIFNKKNNSSNSNRCKSIMVVGTTSNSGKSIVTAGICRMFVNKGKKVSPFKAQNMSLNSFVTQEGGEMGRAQVVQAEAAKIEPHTDMNPVLLKPLGNAKSQVIVDGKAIGNYSARDYYEKKGSVRDYAFAAYDRLTEKNDMIILEGAGSPAEINLMNEDFVNMRMAEHAEAATILVADIDRGGVFASIYGTIKLIPRKWRPLIKGIIINKFRGDVSLLDSGIKDIENLTGIPVLGVLPFIENLNIEEEDSLGLEKKFVEKENALDIAVIRLPKMSNYTDFFPLETSDKINLRYVTNARKLGTPDMVIIPGTKNVISDMKFIRESGFEIKLNSLRDSQTPIIGICGGYQILGEKIADPNLVEEEDISIKGLGFLSIQTILEKEKELAQVKGLTNEHYPFVSGNASSLLANKKLSFTGYEIHCGKTISNNSPLNITSRNSKTCNENTGTISDNKLIFGSYVHGFFDSKEIVTELIKYLFNKKETFFEDDISEKEDPYDRLAKILEDNINFSILDQSMSSKIHL